MEYIHLLDLYILNKIITFRTPELTIFFKAITTLGSAYVIIPILLITIAFSFKYLRGTILICGTLLSFIANRFLKFIFKRPRPATNLAVITESYYSFPSAHSMISVTFYGIIIYLIWKNFKSKGIKITATIFLIIAVLLICFSRMYLGVHYFSDVLVGMLLGFIPLLFLPKIHKLFKN